MIVALAIAADAAQQDNAQLLDRAEGLLRSSNFSEARPLFEQALKTARDADVEPDIARALLGLGQVARGDRRVADGRSGVVEAIAILERLDDHARLAEASNLMAAIEQAARNVPAAILHAERALAVSEANGNHLGIAHAAFHLAELSGDTEAQGRLFERAAASANAAGDEALEGVALHRFGDRLFTVGRYEESLQLLTRAAAVFEQAKQTLDLGTVYNSIGRVYRAHGRYDEALRYQKAALELHRPFTTSFALLQSLNAVSSVYLRLNDVAASRSYLDQALALAASLPPGPAVSRAADFLRANMAALLIDAGDMAAAAKTLEEVIASGRDDFPTVRYAHLSQAYLGLGRPEDALVAAERSVALCGNAIVECVTAHNALSDAQAAVGNRDAALAELALTLRGIEDQRAQLVPADFFKQDFSASYERAYGSAIARQLDAGEELEALQTGELARSRAFLDLLASKSMAPASASVPTLPLTSRGEESRAASPWTMTPSTAADLVRTAARLGSSLLVYWVSADETVIWVVSPDGQVNARRVKVTRSKLSSLIQATAPFSDSRPATAAPMPMVLRESPRAWRELHALLIAPVKPLLPKTRGALLTIVPHDALTNLSFAALKDERGRYLLEDYALHYAPAGALLQFTASQRRPSPRSGGMLMVADPDPARRSRLDPVLPRLPGARTEAAAITRQITAGRVVSLNGAAATESAIREQAPGRSILHFAAHTVVRDDDPFASYLALGRSAGGEDADGILTAQDVYGLKLRSDLVVLSSCRSASGTIAGDGVATFARAFLYAGAASMIASTWEVADQPADRLLPEFYRAWFNGASKAVALRQAQLGLLADLRNGRVRVATAIGPVPVPEHPVFWAGFILYGEPQ
ncbi:MAG: CHAT domain-containing protein [Cyanobacteria bacterium]|nr:CHAT domain-containing protein [Cyanobacteriota bacterium]